QLDVATRALTSELYRAPTEAEIAERLGFDIERWRHMVVELRNTGLISANTRTTEHEDLPEPDYPATPETQPDKICARSQMKSALNQAMTCLPDRYRQVVDLYYTNEMTMKEIGGILEINESRVSQIHKASLAKMEVSLQEVGIHSAGAF
ncbi:MAG: sigma-70 family RNA polymerase sigma factor, partial [Bryobacteraceae bacterium]|nr:sigma-70 family RNA polymerase sigma factor [Bryobacteraceae bacterium]